MDEQDALQMPHRPVQYHPALAPKKAVVNAIDLPVEHVRPLDGRARQGRTLFWVGLTMLSLGTLAFSTILALS